MSTQMSTATATNCAPCARDTAICPCISTDECPPTCTICLEPLAHPTGPTTITDPPPEPAVTVKKCGHVFGRKCLMHWLRDSNTCPMCRVELFYMPQTSRMELDVESNGETPYYALGAYASSGMMQHFSGLVVGTRHDAGGDAEGIGRRRREEGEGEERFEGVARATGARTYYA